jgi:transposase
MHDQLRRQCHIAAGRRPEPTAAVIDPQAVKAAEEVARPGRGFGAGKKINGRTVTSAWADGGYAGRLLPWAQASPKLTVEVVKRTAAHAFAGLRRRWMGERALAWITRSRRTVRDHERLTKHHAAMGY